MNTTANHLIPVGRICSSHGVKGWIKVLSFTDPANNLFEYQPWHIVHPQSNKRFDVTLEDYVPYKAGFLAKFKEFDSPETVVALRGTEIQVARTAFGQTAEDEYYYADLEGLEVVNLEGINLGHVDHILETGAHPVLVVQGGDKPHLIPWANEIYIKKVDLSQKSIQVDWQPDF